MILSRSTKAIAALLCAACAAPLLSGCGGGGKGGGASPASAIEYAYVPDGKTIDQYAVLASGDMQALAQITGKDNELIAVTPNSKFVYISNPASKTISQYSIGTSGTLTPLTPGTVAVPADEVAFVVSPVSPFGFEVISNGTQDGSIVTVPINSNGTLSSQQTTQSSVIGLSPSGYSFSPSGSCFYVTDRDADIYQYQVSSSGTLTALSPLTVLSGTSSIDTANGIAFSPNGQFAYVSDSGGGVIDEFPIESSGELNSATAMHLDTGTGPHGLTVDPTGHYIYAVGDDALAIPVVWICSINQTTGSPSLISNETETVNNAKSVGFDPSGKFMYVTGSSTIAIYSEGTTGALTVVSKNIPAGTGNIGFALK